MKPTNMEPIHIPFFVCDTTENVHITSYWGAFA